MGLGKVRRLVLVSLLAAAMLGSPHAVRAKEKPPPPGEKKELSFPSFKEFKTKKNKMEVVVVEHHEQPVVTISFVIKVGSSTDPREKASLCDFVVQLLNKGTEKRSSVELAEWIESAGGQVSLSSDEDFSTITVSILSEYIDVAYQYLYDIIINPTFPEDELEELRKRVKTALELELSDPGAVASRRFREVVYGDHPYAEQPTPETVDAVTREDIVDFYKRNYVANNVLVAVVGDVDWRKVKKALKKHFGSWERGNPEEPFFPLPPSVESNRIYLYHKPGAVQTNIVVGHTALGPKHPDWPALTVANRILGGGADSRLFMNLREEKGWTYGAYSRFTRPKDLGYFSAGAAVRTEVTDSALVELINELRRISEEPVSEEELEHATSYLVGKFPTSIETPNQIASQVVRVKLLDLGKKYLEEYRDRISSVTIDDVSRVMKKYLHPDKATIVLVGDATAIREKVEKVAPIELFDLEGEPLSFDELVVRPVHYDYNVSGLRDMEASYTLSVPQMPAPFGSLSVNLKRVGRGKDELISVSKRLAGMMHLEEMIELRADNLSPSYYKSQISVRGQKFESELRFKDGVASGTVQGMGMEEPKQVSIELVEGAIIEGELGYVLTVMPLDVSKEYRFPAVEATSGSLLNIKVEVVGEEEISVPAGTFSALKVKVKGSQGESYYYYAKGTPHTLVKQEIPRMGLSIELTNISK